jgi:CheY-like chemotaxis protein
LPLAGKSVLIIEDEALIAMSVESCLQNAGAAVVVANSIALAQSALDEGIPFDAAVVDLLLADGDASPLIQGLSERGIPVVITTGDEVDRGQGGPVHLRLDLVKARFFGNRRAHSIPLPMLHKKQGVRHFF